MIVLYKRETDLVNTEITRNEMKNTHNISEMKKLNINRLNAESQHIEPSAAIVIVSLK